MKRFPSVYPAIVVFLFLLSACGAKEGTESADTQSSDASSSESASVTAAGTATVSGTITFEGTAPDMPMIRMDRECNELNTESHRAQTVVVNENGTLKNVFIHVTSGLGDGYNFSVPAEPVVFDQRGCTYSPHVFGVQVGQDIKILNSDPLLHNIHALAEKNRPFNFGMPRQGDERVRSFRVSEVMLKIKCDVHPWMSAYAGVVDHPYFSVSDDTGAFAITNLPAGTYTFEAWHEKYGTATQSVTVGEGESAELSFAFGTTSS